MWSPLCDMISLDGPKTKTYLVEVTYTIRHGVTVEAKNEREAKTAPILKRNDILRKTPAFAEHEVFTVSAEAKEV